jgi:hypothetical protein
MADGSEVGTERRATYITLVGLFLSLLGAFALREREANDLDAIDPFDMALLGLSTYRVSRLTSYDQVTEWLRAPITQTESTQGGGATIVPKGRGAQRALGELISCPTCVGTWVAGGLVYGLAVAPRPTRAFLAIIGASGIAELLDSATEALKRAGAPQ